MTGVLGCSLQFLKVLYKYSDMRNNVFYEYVTRNLVISPVPEGTKLR